MRIKRQLIKRVNLVCWRRFIYKCAISVYEKYSFHFSRSFFTSASVIWLALLPKLFLVYVSTSAISWSLRCADAGMTLLNITSFTTISSSIPFNIILISVFLSPSTHLVFLSVGFIPDTPDPSAWWQARQLFS